MVVQIPNLTPVIGLSGDEQFEVVQAGSSMSVMLTQIAQFVISGAVGVNTISFGSTGLTPNSPTGSDVVVGGILNVTHGGTGADTAPIGFNNLSPLTTRGDLLVRDAVGNTRLPIGPLGFIATSDGTDVLWAPPSGGGSGDVVGPASSISGGPAVFANTTGKLLASVSALVFKTSIGLENVDNTSDANKPISTATQTALDGKEFTLIAGTNISIDRTVPTAPIISAVGGGGGGGDVFGPVSSIAGGPVVFNGTTGKIIASPSVASFKTSLSLENVNNTSDANKPVSTATQTALNAKEFVLTAGTNITIDRTVPTAPVISATAGASGDVVGPVSSAAASVAGFADTTGKLIKQLSATEIRAAAGLATTDSPEFAAINLGNASDTTLTRSSAGKMAIEGVLALLASDIGVTVQAYNLNLTAWAAKTVPTGAVVGDTDTQVLSGKTIDDAILRNTITVEGFAFNTGTDAAVDLANGTLQVPTLTGNWNPSSWPTPTLGQGFRMIIKTGAGGFAITWAASVRWAAGTAPTLTATASKADIIDFESDGTNWYGYVVGQAYVP
jgi:hypothetical protein